MPSPLGQQELLAPPPPARHIIVPPAHTSWFGCDPSTSRLAIAYATPEGPQGVDTVFFADLRHGARMAHIGRETRRFVRELLEVWPWPGLVFMEQPSGAHPSPQLSYAVGVMLGAVCEAIEDVTGAGIAVAETTSAHWKRVACGRGNISKPTKKSLGRAPVFEDYGVAVWAAANGYSGSSWDEADAMGLAECARRDVGLVQR